MKPSALIYWRTVEGKGRGVFAYKPIKKGAIIEQVPVLLVPVAELIGGLHSPILARFFYLWTKKHAAIALGYGSLYNHSYTPNAHYQHGRTSITYAAIRDIRKGEEITINYNGDPQDRTPVGFPVV